MTAACELAPPCADECLAVLREKFEETCASLGVPVPDYVASHLAPVVKTGYVDLEMVCPHGVVWHMEPTSDQVAEWIRDGVE